MSSILLICLSSLIISALGSLIIYKFGRRFGLVDTPNERSSHTVSTPRSGGIGIWLAFILLGLLFTKYKNFTVFAGLIGLIGLFEDRYDLSPKIRLLLQFAISSIVVALMVVFPNSAISLLLFLFWIVFITGTANYYNFMDGIDGIAGLTGLVGFGLLSVFSFFIVNETDIALMSIGLAGGCLGFIPFNFPKAKVFIGDVGSIFLGFVFASFVIKLSTNIGIFLCLIMFLCTFYADATVTIFFRWRRGEKLMKAHRSHLYQYMSNELAIPHWIVSTMYALFQLIIGVLSIWAYKEDLTWQIILFIVHGVVFMGIYIKIKSIKPKNLHPVGGS